MTTINNQEQTIVAPLGQALQDARHAASLSVDDVAQQLNLGPQTVRDIEEVLDEIIENKKYPTIYLRGYLANYAKLVALDNVEQFIEYQQLSVSQSKQKSLRSPMIIHPVKKRGKWLWLLFILIVIAGISFAVAQQATLFSTEVISANFAKMKASTTDVLAGNNESAAEVKASSVVSLNVHSVNSETSTQITAINSTEPSVLGDGSVAEVKVSSAVPLSAHNDSSEAINKNAERDTTEIAETTIVSKVLSTTQKTNLLAADEQLNEQKKPLEDGLIQKNKMLVAEQKVVNKEPLIGSQQQPLKKTQHNESLQLSFSGECWTEVFDVTGKRLAFNLYKEGAVLTVLGRAPFKLKLGDPSVVAIQYQDKKVEREFVTGRTVTFSVPQML